MRRSSSSSTCSASWPTASTSSPHIARSGQREPAQQPEVRRGTVDCDRRQPGWRWHLWIWCLGLVPRPGGASLSSLLRRSPATAPLINAARPLVADRDRGRDPHAPTEGARRPGGCSRSACSSTSPATSTPTAIRSCSAPRCRSRRPAMPIYLVVYPALMAGLLMLVRRRNPAGDRAGADRLAHPHDRHRPALVGLPGRAEHPSFGPLRPREGCIGRVSARRHPAAGCGDPARRRRRQADTGLLLAHRQHRLAARHRLRLQICAPLTRRYNHQLIYDAGWIAYYVLWGAAALHPSMRTLEQPSSDAAARLTPPGSRCSAAPA